MKKRGFFLIFIFILIFKNSLADSYIIKENISSYIFKSEYSQNIYNNKENPGTMYSGTYEKDDRWYDVKVYELLTGRDKFIGGNFGVFFMMIKPEIKYISLSNGNIYLAGEENSEYPYYFWWGGRYLVTSMYQKYNPPGELLDVYLERFPSDIGEHIIKCVDTDNGLDYYQEGSVRTIAHGILMGWMNDTCAYNNSIMEYYCDGQHFNYSIYYCEEGCANGSCKKKSCIKNSDCNDNLSYTSDKCLNNICISNNITNCDNDDGYCPLGCVYIIDNDCINPNKCETNKDCEDNDVSTKDECLGEPKECYNKKIIECINNDNYCPQKCKFNQDSDCPECLSDGDCDDKKLCTKNVCLFSKCVFEVIGCDLKNECVPVKFRNFYFYCNKDGNLKFQKIDENCENDYECASNKCRESKCIKVNFFKKFLLSLKKN